MKGNILATSEAHLGFKKYVQLSENSSESRNSEVKWEQKE